MLKLVHWKSCALPRRGKFQLRRSSALPSARQWFPWVLWAIFQPKGPRPDRAVPARYMALVGGQDLTFQHDSTLMDGLPMATEYSVSVPAGTRSVNGAALEKTVTWTFRTPPATIVTTYPDGTSQPLEPLFFVEFDQRIDPASVLETIHVKAGSEDVAIISAGEVDIEKDERVRQFVESAPEGR